MRQHQLDIDEMGVLWQALVTFAEYCHDRRKAFGEIHDNLAKDSLDHRDLPMIRERIEYFTKRAQVANDLLLYANHGVLIAEYDEAEMESII
jgi:hypothetical protein